MIELIATTAVAFAFVLGAFVGRRDRPAPDISHRFAREVVINRAAYTVDIDGQRFPYWLREVPTVEHAPDDIPMTCVTLEVWVDGTVTITNKED